jgi:hypothetical protein
MLILAYTKDASPGVLVFVDLSGEEDSILVSPGRSYRLRVREVVRHNENVVFQVLEGSMDPGGVVLRKKKTQESQPG